MSRRYPRSAVPAATIADDAHRAMSAARADHDGETVMSALHTDTDDTEDPPMKIQFTSVQLHKTVPRLDAGVGQATQDTTFFDVARAKVAIEYDTATQLVRISKGTACVYIPLTGVERFGPTVEDVAAVKAERAAIVGAFTDT